MKWGVVILLLLGVVAAACAALLMGSMGTGSSAAAKNPQGIEVVVAKRYLPAMSVVTLDDFVKQMVSKNELPQGPGQLTNPTRVIGRVLAMPVVEGQVLSESCFISEGTGPQVVAAIPDGMRAVTLNLNSRAVPDALFLYPGSVVDILFSFKLSSRSVGEAGSLTILSGIQVIAVNGESIVSDPEKDANAKTRKAAGLQVTVLVDQKQAEALQVLSDNGIISLTIRNPLDKTVGDMQATLLSQGQLARLSSLLTAEGVAAPQKERAMRDWLAAQVLGAKDPNEQADGNDTFSTPIPSAQTQLEEQYPSRHNSSWGVTVFRGAEKKTQEFDAPGEEAAPADTAK